MDENMNVYQNPLTGRYASKEMSYNWSPQRKHSTWRRLWLALGVLDDPSILEATQPLLVPGGMRSLAAGDPLYKGAYTGDEDTSRKPAYHNGTVWAWVFPIYAEAMARLDPSRRSAALALLSGAVENINAGCVAHESEIADGDSPHAQKGCTAQAWSVSELLRVWRALA